MFNILTKDAHFVWDSQCQTAFEILKEKLSTTSVLQGPNWSLPFHISTDPSDTDLGAVLGQKEKSNNPCYLLHKQKFNTHKMQLHSYRKRITSYSIFHKHILTLHHRL